MWKKSGMAKKPSWLLGPSTQQMSSFFRISYLAFRVFRHFVMRMCGDKGLHAQYSSFSASPFLQKLYHHRLQPTWILKEVNFIFLFIALFSNVFCNTLACFFISLPNQIQISLKVKSFVAWLFLNICDSELCKKARINNRVNSVCSYDEKLDVAEESFVYDDWLTTVSGPKPENWKGEVKTCIDQLEWSEV